MFARRSGSTAILVAALFVLALLWSQGRVEARPSRLQTHADARAAAAIVVRALRDRNGAALAAITHPARGVRFSPSAFVDPASDVVLSRTAVRRLWADRRIYRWGYAEGSGDPIELTPAQYVARFTLPEKALKPDSITVDRDRARGNVTNNAAKVYAQARRVEYFWRRVTPGADPAFDWRALRLVFEPVRGRLLLVGMIHDSWSP